jgi:hypothetical protein
MACKKSELISAINSFAAARAANDPNLVAFGSQLVSQYVDTLEYAPEDDSEEEEFLEDEVED